MNKDFIINLGNYLIAMEQVKTLLESGVISRNEYEKIDEILANKYGINSCSIYRQNP